MKQTKYTGLKLVLVVFFTLLTFWITGNYLLDAEFYKDFFTTVSIRDHTNGISKSSLTNVLERSDRDTDENSMSLTAWNTEYDVLLTNPNLGRSATVLAITLWGDMKTPIPMSLLAGNYVYQEDYSGCVLDSKTAYTLFGTKNAIGNELIYNNNSYIVRGIVKCDVPIFLLQSYKSNETFSNLEIKLSNHYRGIEEMTVTNFLSDNSLTEKYTSIDGYFYGTILHFILFLPVWLFILSILIYTLRNSLNKKNYITFLLTLIILFFTCLHMYKVGDFIYLIKKFTPTRWSDFSYWSKVRNTLGEDIKQLSYLSPNPRDLLLKNTLTTLGYRFFLLILLYLQLFFISKKYLTKLTYPWLTIEDIKGKIRLKNRINQYKTK